MDTIPDLLARTEPGLSPDFDLKTRHELAGVPEWLLEEKFVVNAAAPQGTTDAQIRLMVQDLLAERFKLRLRKEEGALPVWTLTLDRADGRLGPQLTPSRSRNNSVERPIID